jgi:broad specificity phosphatase PhoE
MTALMPKTERTHGPLPRLVPHGGINRDMIVMMGGLPGDRFRRFGPPPGPVTVDRIQAIGAAPVACADWGALDPHQQW